MTDIVSDTVWTTVPRSDLAAPLRLPDPVSERYKDPAGYDPGPELVAAVNVSLLLGQALLLTGEPGCGKTSVGAWLSRQLGLGDPLVHNVKSTSVGRELLYEFDELARFRDAQPGGTPRPQHYYLRLNALGLAIVLTRGQDTMLPGVDKRCHRDLTWQTLPALPAPQPGPDPRFARRHVVLIDELDKAPRDTPNDLLFEIERMEFRIPELGTAVTGDPALRPIVVITSNSEKSLPEPFLRRCVFHHIRAPDEARRRQIVQRRRHPFAERTHLFEQAMTFYDRLPESLGRAPGTAELLAWLEALDEAVRQHENGAGGGPVQTLKGLIGPTLGTLAKTREDLGRAADELGRAGLD
ncbi:MoxR family ATPase [Limobrevibacterium gyesilva]|uniref:MoxR family ATPase n=1 Tax=Limobrevibacterium gyesilva TaxID=2991712 RepID=A0AA42CEZ2_9PROT|nr:MoxR family ATPase [Limobrevibacterium gyesilva]MCW3474181.1 MoxR family ATPase [Limobrevibacterium gyesilva]